jgi:calcineurin-like phosphoesterase family protein
LKWGALTPVAIVVAIGAVAATSPPASGSPVVAAVGDIACDPGDRNFNSGNGTSFACRQKYTSDLVVNRGLAAVLALGDLQYEDATLWKFLNSYGPTWGRVKSITHPAVGNHEYATYGAGGYFDYFNGAGVQIGVAGDRLGGGHYSFDVGAWHLIALNSNCNDVYRGCGPGSPQEQWLRRDLASHPATCTLAFMHHPVFTSGAEAPGIDTLRPMFQALYDYGAEVLLTGHDHNYERFAPQDPAGVLDRSRGVREFVVGTGGKVLYQQGTPLPNSEVRNDESFGVLLLTLHPTSYEWRFVPAAGSTFADAGNEACRTAPGYARPRSAGRMTMTLVPASSRCTSPNAVHGPSLVAPSCSPAAQSSRYLTVGTPDLNGQPAGFRGYLSLTVMAQVPVDPSDGDQADVKINATLDDVRRAGDFTDYTGQLQGRLLLRITDRVNTGSLTQPATASDLPLSFAISCQATPADPNRGSTCNLASSIDTVLAGAALEGKRSIWEVKEFSVFDGGPDGIAATPGNSEFASPGLFTP